MGRESRRRHQSIRTNNPDKWPSPREPPRLGLALLLEKQRSLRVRANKSAVYFRRNLGLFGLGIRSVICKLSLTGFEVSQKPLELQAFSDFDISGARFTQRAGVVAAVHVDPRLQAIIDAWPRLTEQQRDEFALLVDPAFERAHVRRGRV